jgi:hypothetical protein
MCRVQEVAELLEKAAQKSYLFFTASPIHLSGINAPEAAIQQTQPRLIVEKPALSAIASY